jgi:glutathione S-transferase
MDTNRDAFDGDRSTYAAHHRGDRMTIIVHHLENSRSQRVLWMLEELGLPYEVKRYERNKKTMLAPPELRRVHPLGKSPVIQDSDDNDRVVAETGAIVEYLVDKADGKFGAPAKRDDSLGYRFWLHYAEGSLMPPLLLKLVLGRIPLLGKSATKRIQPMIDVHLDFVERSLSDRPWFAGDRITAADVMMSFPLEAARSRAGLSSSRPNTIAWLERVHARPAYQKALEVGGPYAYA